MSFTSLLGLFFLLSFVILMGLFSWISRNKKDFPFRSIPAFTNLRRAIRLSVEAGKRIHISLGRGGASGQESASAFLGLSVLERIVKVASISDNPPIATSGDSTITVLGQDTIKGIYQVMGIRSQVNLPSSQLTGISPFSYAAGTLPILFDEQVSTNILLGHFGSEVALITDAAERNGALTLAGSDQVQAQAVLYAAAQEPLIGEEFFAASAYLHAGAMHSASLRVQDVARWVLAVSILLGAFLKILGVI